MLIRFDADMFRREKILVNKKVMLRKENPKSWMRMVPANYFFLGKISIFDLVDMLPSILCESNVRATFI